MTSIRCAPLWNSPLAWLGAGAPSPMRCAWACAWRTEEALYGTGERFDRFDRRGKRFDCRVYEQYKDQGSRTYLPVPMLFSSRGYALGVEGTRPLRSMQVLAIPTV